MFGLSGSGPVTVGTTVLKWCRDKERDQRKMLHDVRDREDNRLGDAANGGCKMENCNGKSRWIIQKLLAIATTLLLFSSSAHGLENDLCNWTGRFVKLF